ncbi:MAG: hypothetical protein LBV60_22670 [Streptomyces sp.]|jgi:hypothetical protein|nr:hypothetical protein [Streptomyces sp.]
MDRSPIPLRSTIVLTGIAVLMVYELSPDFQRWVNYQAVRAGEWLRYGVEWLAWKQRQQERRRHER